MSDEVVKREEIWKQKYESSKIKLNEQVDINNAKSRELQDAKTEVGFFFYFA